MRHFALSPLFLFLLIANQHHVMSSSPSSSEVKIVDFSDANPSIQMETVDDPVMGGKSHSTCSHEGGALVWKGVVRTVPFLDAPGFCNLQTKDNPNLSVLQTTHGVAFYVRSASSNFFHPMGINLQNGLRTSNGIPISYSAPSTEVVSNKDGTTKLYANWTDFTASAYGQPIKDAPPLDSQGLSRANQLGLSTYQAHQEGRFHMEILSVVGLISSDNQEEEEVKRI